MSVRCRGVFSVVLVCCLVGIAPAAPPEPADPPQPPAAEAAPQDPAETPADQPAPPAEPAPEQPATPELPAEIVLDEFLVIPKLGVYGRVPLHRDPLEALIARGEFPTPSDGDSIDAAVGSTRRWRTATAGDDGTIDTSAATGGYAVANVESPSDRVMLLDAKGHANVYVNGRLHAGDPYAIGWLPVPVQLNKGSNQLLFQVAQRTLTAKLVARSQSVMLDMSHSTQADVVPGVDEQVWLGVPVMNASNEPLSKLKLTTTAGGDVGETEIAFLDRLSCQKVAVPVAVPSGELVGELPVRLQLVDNQGATLASADVALPCVEPSAMQRRTFRSAIDASAQTYVLVPATDSQADAEGRLAVAGRSASPGMLVALHDLGVSAEQFARQLTPSSEWHIVVPTGRSAFGFDWEDWSLRDIDEAVSAAGAIVQSDDRPVVAIGHGVGGHGVLHWGATRPDRLAAAAIFGGWPSLWTYGGGRPDAEQALPLEQLLLRPANGSDTLALIGNLRNTGLLVMHSADDAYVSIDQSRQLLAALADEHNDYAFRALDGADHQWSTAADQAEAISEFLNARMNDASTDLPQSVRLNTADPAACSSSQWVSVLQQSQPRQLSSVEVTRKDNPPAITGTTTNVRRISFDVSMMPDDKPFYVQLDRSRPAAFRQPPDDDVVYLTLRDDGRWIPTPSVPATAKSPTRGGGLKSVFDRRPLLIYGTGGSEEQQRWAESKAHYDAEQFLYRGNGRLEVVPDTQWNKIDQADRNVVLYGNADTNKVWPALLSTCDIQVRGDGLTVDTRPEAGDDLAVIMVRPRPDSEVASVAVIGGTGLTGMRLTSRLRYFTAGIDYPDLLVFGPKTLDEGVLDVRAAGYFDGEWKLDDDNFAWRDLAL